MEITRTTLLTAACAALLAGPLSACGSSDDDKGKGGAGEQGAKSGDAPSHEAKVVGSSTKKGDFPATFAHATLENPGAIKVRATPSPAASTAMSWTIACRRGRKAGTTAGRFKVSDKTTKTLRKPMKRADSCNVSASAQMSKRGAIKVEIIG